MSEDVTAWLAANAVHLDSLTAGSPSADLMPLKRTLAGVRAVGLGEATHGTREFFQLKHRLLEFLVTEMGFSVLAMEASASAALAVDAYVTHGVGEAEEVLAGLGFWTWRTYEVLDVIEWLRAYNRERPDAEKVRFVGIDPQRCGDSVAALDTFLRAAVPERAAAFRTVLGGLADAAPGSAWELVSEPVSEPVSELVSEQPRSDPRHPWTREAGELADFLERNAADLTRLTSAARVDTARSHARLLVRAADLASRPLHHEDPEHTAFAVRDRYMAEAVAALLDRDDAPKVAVWGHNGHIMTGHYGGAGGGGGDRGGVPALGWHLRQRYDEAYYGLGLLFGKGAFRAWRAGRRALARPASARRRRPVRNTIGAPSYGSGSGSSSGSGSGIGSGSRFVEATLSGAVAGLHMVNLRADDVSPAVARWLREPHLTRSFGACVPRFTYRLSAMPTVLAEEYDGLVFVPESTCSRPLPGADPAS
ncbi:erythromycin esterase family protein [Streptomyces varsoviensis]|uniref:erythromycin esterase family protein n=1 Tax=Streptomyces varsoviensis TaxID=67373 RepID=UPI0033F883C4